MKLKILRLISNMAYKIYYWADDQIINYSPKPKKSLELFIKDGFILSAMVTFVLIAIFHYWPRNIQDIKPKVKIKKEIEQVKPVETHEKRELNELKKHFKWLTEPVYAHIIKESGEEVDPIMTMSIMQVESGNHCGNNWKCMTQVRGNDGEYGAMQVMGYHAPNPDDLKNWKYNTKRGVAYFKGALEIGRGNIRVAVRLYNQGHAGKWQNYKRWSYVSRIMRVYKKALTKHVMVKR